MTPVTGPYVGPANPVRGVAGGGLPWVLTAGRGSLMSDGHLLVQVQGLVLARQAPVPPALQGTNPFPDFKADTAGNSTINATLSLPRPCIAPIVFVTGPTGTNVWFAVTGS